MAKAGSLARPRVLSGIQPSGGLHLGNYLGAIRNWAADLDSYDNFFCIVDLHALTVPQDPELLRQHTLDLAAAYIAAGLDPEKCRIFVQSQISAHAEVGWVLQCFIPLGWLERMTQFKQKSGDSRERASAGLFAYPALMAADILLYDPDYVPVGDDQRQHIELTRDVAQRINGLHGDVFKIPEPLIRAEGARIMGLDDPTVKMSKSAAEKNSGHAVFLLDPPDVVRRKFMRAKTDTRPAVEPPLEPGVANLLDIYAATQRVSADGALRRFQGEQYGSLKSAVADVVIEALAQVQERYHELRDDETRLRAYLEESADVARTIANATRDRLFHAVGVR